MEIFVLQNLWYCVFVFSMFAYAALDGFDLGVGCLHLFCRDDTERRIFLNAIGPVWDGNSLWVIITSGVLLSGFPSIFAVLFSTLYFPMMLLVFGYIFRAVAIEFRSKKEGAFWRCAWDIVFSFASILIPFGFGIILANMVSGMPINYEGFLEGGMSTLFTRYSVILGLFTIALFTLHGALYLNMKTEGPLQKKVQGWIKNIYWFFVAFWIAMNVYTISYIPEVADLPLEIPFLWIILLSGIIGLVAIKHNLSKGNEGWAFMSSFLVILSLILSLVLGTYPSIIKSTIDPQLNSMTIYNSSASPYTLKILLGIAICGVPAFLGYLYYAQKVFRGKVEMDSMSY